MSTIADRCADAVHRSQSVPNTSNRNEHIYSMRGMTERKECELEERLEVVLLRSAPEALCHQLEKPSNIDVEPPLIGERGVFNLTLVLALTLCQRC
jgi:predicted ABC-class ATPase